MGIDKDQNLSATAARRRQAEERLLTTKGATAHPVAKKDGRRLVHELEVHQIELEMQNVELLQTRDETALLLELYTDLYDFAPVGYLTLDRRGTICSINLTGAGLLGRERSRLNGRRFEQFLAEASRPAFATFLNTVFMSLTKETYEAELLAEGNSPRCVQIEAVVAASGEHCRLAVIDLSERKRTEEERRKTEEARRESSVRFRTVVDSLDALVYVADMETYEVLLVNRYGREIWGDLTGEICWKSLQAGQTGPCSFCTNSRLLNASGEPAEPVVWEFRNTVTGRWYECRDQAIRWTDGRMVRMEIATDSTERKLAEAEILSLNAELEQRVQQRTAQLEAANKDLEAFSYTVSHDLRTPLVWIGGYSRSILRRYADRLDEQPLQYLREICEGTRQMEILIDNLLDFSQLSYHELRREPVDLSALVRTVATELSHAEPDRRATFRIAEGVTEDGDPHLLLVVLKNLVGNAWKYTGKREEAVIEFGVLPRHGIRVCFVRDNGAGFDMAQVEKLFLPFQRLHETNDFKGHGIGLATVRRIISHHNGEVWAESCIGEGTTFYFTLNGPTKT